MIKMAVKSKIFDKCTSQDNEKVQEIIVNLSCMSLKPEKRSTDSPEEKKYQSDENSEKKQSNLKLKITQTVETPPITDEADTLLERLLNIKLDNDDEDDTINDEDVLERGPDKSDKKQELKNNRFNVYENARNEIDPKKCLHLSGSSLIQKDDDFYNLYYANTTPITLPDAVADVNCTELSQEGYFAFSNSPESGYASSPAQSVFSPNAINPATPSFYHEEPPLKSNDTKQDDDEELQKLALDFVLDNSLEIENNKTYTENYTSSLINKSIEQIKNNLKESIPLKVSVEAKSSTKENILNQANNVNISTVHIEPDENSNLSIIDPLEKLINILKESDLDATTNEAFSSNLNEKESIEKIKNILKEPPLQDSGFFDNADSLLNVACDENLNLNGTYSLDDIDNILNEPISGMTLNDLNSLSIDKDHSLENINILEPGNLALQNSPVQSSSRILQNSSTAPSSASCSSDVLKKFSFPRKKTITGVPSTSHKHPFLKPKPKRNMAKIELNQTLDIQRKRNHQRRIYKKVQRDYLRGQTIKVIYVDGDNDSQTKNQTNLHKAVLSSDLEEIYCLVEIHKQYNRPLPDLNITDKQGNTALDLAIKTRQKLVQDYLKENDVISFRACQVRHVK